MAENGGLKPRIYILIDLYDQCTKEEKNLFESLREKDIVYGVLPLKLGNNSESYRKAYLMALNEESNLILFSEDDYLWREEALLEMEKMMKTAIGVDYITPYDHPVRYDVKFKGGTDLKHWNKNIYISPSWHFRTHESTCMTFMARKSVLKRDKSTHWKYTKGTKGAPKDRELFRELQKLSKGFCTSQTKRLLLGPIPSLATHAHLPYLAPAVDWDKIAKNIKKYI